MPPVIPIAPDNGQENDMAAVPGAVDATIDKVLDQAFARGHEDWIGTQQIAAAGNAFLAEVNRWSMQAAASNQTYLASGILAQRSAQAQPQQPSGGGLPNVSGQGLPV